MEINLIIRELLAKHDFISLPGVGSFTQKYEPAFPSADGQSFIPPKQIVSFDTSRTFNDEAIENYLCEKQGIGHTEASDLLKVFIDRLNYDLDTGKTCVFENVGELFKNKKGRIKFEQATDFNAALTTYGLKSLEVEKPSSTNSKKIKTKEPQPIAKNESNTVRTTSKSKFLVSLSVIVVLAALIVMFILVPEFRFWDKYLTADKTLTELKSDSLQKTEGQKLDANHTDSTSTKKDSLDLTIEQNIADKNVKKAALYYEEPKIQDSKTFYLIVGSFGKVENAQKLLEKYKLKGFNPEIIQGSGMFRVSISKTTDKTQALSDFNKFRSNNPYESVWVLGI